MKTLMTNAPQAYDYPWSWHVDDTDRMLGGRKFRVRVVRVPDDRWQAQAQRYESGLYVVFAD